MLSINRLAPKIAKQMGQDWRDLAGCPDSPFPWPQWLSSDMAKRGIRKNVIRAANPKQSHLILTPQGRAVRDIMRAKRDCAAARLRDSFRANQMEKR